MSTVESRNAVEVNAEPVAGEGTFTWTLKLFERQGTCHLSWRSNAPFRAQQGRICLYKNGFPPDPNQDREAWVWDDSPDNPYDTGKTWGSGWCAAYVAELNGKAVYVCQTSLTA